MSKKKFFMGICFFLILNLAIFCSLSYAQRVTGKIVGKVSDDEGTPLPGVTVEISSPSLMGGVHSQFTSDEYRERIAKNDHFLNRVINGPRIELIKKSHES